MEFSFFRKLTVQQWIACGFTVLIILAHAFVYLMIGFVRFNVGNSPYGYFGELASIFTDGLQAAFLIVTPLILYWFIPIRSKLSNIIVSVIISLYYFLSVVMAYYFVSRRMKFDFYYFWLNRGEVYETLANLYAHLALRIAVLAAVFLIFAWSLYISHRVLAVRTARLRVRYKISVSAFLLLNLLSFPAPLHVVAKNAFATYRVITFTEYDAYYQRSLPSIPPELIGLPKNNNSIIFLHLESLNSQFVSTELTPKLVSLAQKGILLKKHHSNGIQTNRAEDSILCGTIPSINLSYYEYANAADEASKRGLALYCLPKVLKQLGYKTLFFKSHSLTFQRAGEFAQNIGFDEVHAGDIMKPGDPRLKWGYREDVYYQRVVEYINETYPNDKVFAYIAVSSTNHVDWKLKPDMTRSDVYRALPYGGTKDYMEIRKNAVFAQDAYVQSFWDNYSRLRSFATTDVFIYGDHPWAIYDFRPEFSYNIGTAHEQAFLTSLAFIPAENHAAEFNTNSVIETDIGTDHSDIPATVLDVLGFQHVFPHGTSFLPILKGDTSSATACSINAQPFTNLAVTLVQYPDKIIIQLIKDKILYVRLDNGSERAQSIGHKGKTVDAYLEACLHNELSKFIREPGVSSESQTALP